MLASTALRLSARMRLPTGRPARLTSMLLALGSCTLIAGGALASPALAQTWENVTPNNTAALALDVSGASTSPGAPVIDWWGNEGANQQWAFWHYDNGYESGYEIINKNSNQCLTSDGNPGDQVYQTICYGNNNQLWRTDVNAMRTGTYTIQNVYSGLYLDVYGDSPWPGASIDTWYYNGGANQFWSIDTFTLPS
jgi:hypothetical protein